MEQQEKDFNLLVRVAASEAEYESIFDLLEINISDFKLNKSNKEQIKTNLFFLSSVLCYKILDEREGLNIKDIIEDNKDLIAAAEIYNKSKNDIDI